MADAEDPKLSKNEQKRLAKQAAQAEAKAAKEPEKVFKPTPNLTVHKLVCDPHRRKPHLTVRGRRTQRWW